MENVFNFRDKLIDEYSSFSRSFVSIAATDIKSVVEQQYAEGRYWPQPLIQINPNYQRKQTVQELAAQGVLHPTCGEIFKTGKAAGKSDPLYLYKHQIEALALDVVARHKTGGTHMNYFIFKQLPVLPPERYTDTDLAFIVPRVLELTYTAHDLAPWARDLGYDGEPFAFDPARRAQLRAELDAYYARLYGLNREELRYILDPADVLGDDYPSETFRVLKNKELNEFGEYRTRRLVLEAWDKLEAGELR